MAPPFTGKVALVTGGNSGIGLATALAFANAGARLVITAEIMVTEGLRRYRIASQPTVFMMGQMKSTLGKRI